MPTRERDGLRYLHESGAVRLPFNLFPDTGNGGPFRSATQWVDYQWNPPSRSGRQEPDPQASPKPTWDDLVAAGWEIVFQRFKYANGTWVNSEINHAMSEHDHGDITHPDTDEPILLVDDIDHLSSIIHLVSNASIAGQEWPFGILSFSGNPIDQVWTPSEAEKILQPVVRRRNRLESAANIIRKNYLALIGKILDPNGGLDESATAAEKLAARQAAYEKQQTFRNSIASEHLLPALADVDRISKTFPADPDRARAVLKMRSGVAANRRRNQIIHIAEAQDTNLPGSCIEEDNALQRVSFLWQRLGIRLDRATEIEAMQALFDAFIGDLEQIVVLNTPIWRITDGAFPTLDGDGYHVIEWDPDNPPTNNIVGDFTATSPPMDEGDEVAIDVIQTPHGEPHNTNIWFARKYNRPTDGENLQRVSLQYVLPDTPFPEESIIRLYARNVCGPKPLPLRIRRKQPSP